LSPGRHTLHEIMSQPKVWPQALKAFAEQQSAFINLMSVPAFDKVIVSGCGSTYYLAMTAARLLRKSGMDALACPASELLFYPDSIYLPQQRYLLICVSRSGTTSETVRAQANFKAAVSGKIITVTCDSSSPLAQNADLTFAIDAAQEKSVAQTRSFSSMALVLQQMAAALARHDLNSSVRLPAVCQALLDTHANLIKSLAENDSIKKFFFLGADALYGIACEAMLKMKEMSLSYSESFYTMEFRHGPMSMVAEDSLVIGLISPDSATHDLQVLQEMQAIGASILAIAQSETDFQHHIALPAELPSWNTPILYLPPLQLLAYHRALFMGQNPDQPHNLSAVISLDDI